MKKVGVISLGCDKNRVDTENMLYHLEHAGYSITQREEDADILIVNTCAFIQSAREEAVDAIFEAASRRPEKLIVTGCLPQKYIEDIFSDLPEVDAFLGTASYEKLPDIIRQLYTQKERVNAVESVQTFHEPDKRVVTTPYHYAYLKIAEGCGNHCTYCTIPSIRGKYRSREMPGLLEEAKQLAESGVKELILVAQDVTKYGTDLSGKRQLAELLRRLSELHGLHWLRLLYCYPEDVTDELIAEMEQNAKIVKYIDIPLQHVSDGILRRMARRTQKSQIVSLFGKLRERIPGIAIRSTFIVGFPGETEQDFNELLAFLKTEKLDCAGFFAYSQEEGTPAAKYADQISEEVKQARLARCYEVQREISAQKNKERVGKILEVLYDGADLANGYFYGRTQGSAPEIDGIVRLNSIGTIEVGTYYAVKITESGEYDLTGEVLHEFAQ